MEPCSERSGGRLGLYPVLEWTPRWHCPSNVPPPLHPSAVVAETEPGCILYALYHTLSITPYEYESVSPV